MIRSARSAAALLLTLSTLAGAMSGCSSPTSTNNLGIVQVERLSGNGQTGIVNQTLPIALLIQAVDVNDRPVSGATVTWTVSTNGGSVSSTTETTDATGEAAVLWTLGGALGTESVVASAGGVTATFLATAVAASENGMAKAERRKRKAESGNRQAEEREGEARSGSGKRKAN